jgi:hypothetical protein
MTHWSKNCRSVRWINFAHSGHNEFVAVPLKKPDDTGYPKCPDCVSLMCPRDAPLLKVYDYGPLGARFFYLLFDRSERVGDTLRVQRARQMIFNFGGDGGIFV